MNYDSYGRSFVSSDELCDLLYKNPNLDIKNFNVISADAFLFNESVRKLHAETDYLKEYRSSDQSIKEFDQAQQSNWHMPDEYKNLDIAKWVLEQCKKDYELQRVGHELLLYQELNLFDLLRYIKYLVDVMRANNIVWGVGRGSSVSSYVLYLIGIHKIDSIYYQLNINEFLKINKNTDYGEN